MQLLRHHAPARHVTHRYALLKRSHQAHAAAAQERSDSTAALLRARQAVPWG
jgi:hypothetical protein